MDGHYNGTADPGSAITRIELPMTLTALQTASLKQLQQYGAIPPRLRDRLRISAGYMLLLLLPMLTAGALMIWLKFPPPGQDCAW
jgi:hypothetical protein